MGQAARLYVARWGYTHHIGASARICSSWAGGEGKFRNSAGTGISVTAALSQSFPGTGRGQQLPGLLKKSRSMCRSPSHAENKKF